MKYMDHIQGDDNFFSQYGKVVHQTLEKYAKGEISVFEVVEYYVNHFVSDVTMPAPYNKFSDLRDSYFNKGLRYIESVAEYELKGYKVIGVEEEVHFTLNGYEFVGFIDLILQNIETQEIVIIDHKSSSIRILKNGEVSKTSMSVYNSYKTQMYLYSIAIHDKYGKYPSSYILNLFNMRDFIKYDHKDEELQNSIQWAIGMIEEIQQERDFLPNPDDYYCRYLCEYRNSACEYKM